MMKFIKTDLYFLPSADDTVRFEKLPVGVYCVEVVQEKNWLFHKKIFSTINMYLKQQKDYDFKSIGHCAEELKYNLGYGEFKEDAGKTIWCPFSLDMQQSYKRKEWFYNALVVYMSTALGITEYDIKNNWEEYRV